MSDARVHFVSGRVVVARTARVGTLMTEPTAPVHRRLVRVNHLRLPVRDARVQRRALPFLTCRQLRPTLRARIRPTRCRARNAPPKPAPRRHIHPLARHRLLLRLRDRDTRANQSRVNLLGPKRNFLKFLLSLFREQLPPLLVPRPPRRDRFPAGPAHDAPLARGASTAALAAALRRHLPAPDPKHVQQPVHHTEDEPIERVRYRGGPGIKRGVGVEGGCPEGVE
mmetsp:Transcript_4284/g.7809  ORF Transcript_4284/g.7809 Transcript_4284/m.7809 type:complete len:225 (-) Transcript_4284:3009-3683(-)